MKNILLFGFFVSASLFVSRAENESAFWFIGEKPGRPEIKCAMLREEKFNVVASSWRVSGMSEFDIAPNNISDYYSRNNAVNAPQEFFAQMEQVLCKIYEKSSGAFDADFSDAAFADFIRVRDLPAHVTAQIIRVSHFDKSVNAQVENWHYLIYMSVKINSDEILTIGAAAVCKKQDAVEKNIETIVETFRLSELVSNLL